MKFQAAESIRDLGLGFAINNHKAIRIIILKSRRSAKASVNKTLQVAKANREARKLFTGALFSKQNFGFQTAGVSPTEVIQLERQAATI